MHMAVDELTLYAQAYNFSYMFYLMSFMLSLLYIDHKLGSKHGYTKQ